MKASNAARAAILVEALDGLPGITTASSSLSLLGSGADIELDSATGSKLLPLVRKLIEDELSQIGVTLDIAPAITPLETMIPGAPFGDGFYAGQIVVDGLTYALVVAPKTIGEINSIVWKTDWQTATPGTQSVNDGFANTEAMIKAGGHPITDWISKVRSDWLEDAYLPSRDELEVIYRNLKPTTSSNFTYASRAKRWGVKPGKYNGCDENGNGHNAHSIPPGDPYTATSPAQTLAEAYREGGPQAFERAWYWSSTEFAPDVAWVQFFDGGNQDVGDETSDRRCRAVRKVLI